MPFIHEGDTFGIIFSLVVVVIAALNLILDFDFIEQGVKHQAPNTWNPTVDVSSGEMVDHFRGDRRRGPLCDEGGGVAARGGAFGQ
jgi:hypothetical protein